MSPALEQEIIDACTAMKSVRESAKNGDSAMMVAALKDVRNRLLKAADINMPAAAIVASELPTSPRLPIKEGEP